MPIQYNGRERDVRASRPLTMKPVREVTMAAKKCSKCFEEKPLSSFYKQKNSPDGHAYWCKPCAKIAHAEYIKNNAERVKKNYAEYYAKNIDRMRKKTADWHKNNKDISKQKYKEWRLKTLPERAAKMAEWREKNPGKSAEFSRKWQKENLHKCRASNAKRYAAKLKAVPKWAEIELIKVVYEKARKLGFVVDHVVPLQSDVVCGLHVWANLQLLTDSENARKRNRYWPDMP